MKIITRRSLLLLSCLLGTLIVSKAETNIAEPPPPSPQPSSSTTITATPETSPSQPSTAGSPTPATSITATSSPTPTTTTTTAISVTTATASTSTSKTDLTTLTSQPSSTSTQPSTSTAGSTAVQTTQSIPSTSEATGSTTRVTVTTSTQTISTAVTTSTQTISTVVTTTNSTNTTTPGGGLNSSETALTVVFGIALGMVVLGLIAWGLAKRRQRTLPFSHQRLYSSTDDSVDLFAPPEDTLVISGGLYDGTQMTNPVDGNVMAAQAFPVQPSPMRLEFLNDTLETTPNQASTFQTF